MIVHPLGIESIRTTIFCRERCPIVFLVVLFLDSFILRSSTFLSEDLSALTRFVIGVPFLFLALYLMYKSHQMVFEDFEGRSELLNTGTYGRVRHPMYLGSLMIYLFFIISSPSILAILTWMAIFVIYDRLAAYGERVLLEDLGDNYAEYMKRVHRWLPI